MAIGKTLGALLLSGVLVGCANPKMNQSHESYREFGSLDTKGMKGLVFDHLNRDGLTDIGILRRVRGRNYLEVYIKNINFGSSGVLGHTPTFENKKIFSLPDDFFDNAIGYSAGISNYGNNPFDNEYKNPSLFVFRKGRFGKIKIDRYLILSEDGRHFVEKANSNRGR